MGTKLGPLPKRQTYWYERPQNWIYGLVISLFLGGVILTVLSRAGDLTRPDEDLVYDLAWCQDYLIKNPQLSGQIVHLSTPKVEPTQREGITIHRQEVPGLIWSEVREVETEKQLTVTCFRRGEEN
jgi:hypothetical protein